ncbi:DNA-3-methyladenine glycosylase family protein [Kineococcus terrestris]|uniref:DNA-3-methyladenine glycosylase family protein n=1 Tax=Kineococcus terrestris TaxID=2044856 RepID=UPI0035A14D3B
MILSLPAASPLALTPLRRFLAAHAVPGLERHDPVTGEHARLVPGAGGPVAVSVRLGGEGPAGAVEVEVADGPDPAGVAARVARWLDLDADTRAPEAALARDELLGPLVRARPGLRVPRAVDGAETALLTVLGQQVSLAAARTFAGRLVAAHGRPGPGGLRAFPEPAVLAAAGPEALRAVTGVTGARARTLHALAAALADGLELDAADRAGTRAALLALPGVGPWTADYVALRVLGDDDVFLDGDLVARRAVGDLPAAQVRRRAAAWSPWRSYALLHLWTGAVFA